MARLNYGPLEDANKPVATPAVTPAEKPKFFSDKASDKFATFISMQQVANQQLKFNQQDDKQLKGNFGNSLTSMQNSSYGWGSK